MKTQLIPIRTANKPRKMRVVPLPIVSAPLEQGTFIRFEEKFFLPKQNSLSFKTSILKYLSLSSPIPGTQFTGIESVYFDSPDFQIYQMHFAARQEERFKVRARSYAPNGVPGDGSAHLEYKSKHAGVSKKTRFQIGPEELKLLWEGYTIPGDSKTLEGRNPELEEEKLEERVKHINTLISGIRLKPSCIVRYRREAFEGGNLRLTIDDQIAFETTRSFSGMRPMLDSNPDLNEAAIRMRTAFQHGEYLLVEVKHPGSVPLWLTEILNANHCQKAKFSKYCYSVTEALLA
jgi:SPX domain protein involved in polyphosphate accumulation